MINIDTNILLGSLTFIIIVLLYWIFILRKGNKEQLQVIKSRYLEDIAQLKKKHNDELNVLKDSHRAELNGEFEKGYQRGLTISRIEVQISPFKRSVKKGNFISKSENYECGYKYQLFSNGLPCLEPKEVILDSISVKEINEENVNNILEKFTNVIDKIPNTSLQLGQTLDSFKTALLSLRKK